MCATAVWLWIAPLAAQVPASEHLTPSSGALTAYEPADAYRERLHELLLGGQNYRHIQLVTMPSFEPEMAVFILHADDAHDTPKVVFRKMRKNLHSLMSEQVMAMKGPPWSFRTEDGWPVLKRMRPEMDICEAQLDLLTFVALDALWQRALRSTAYGDGERGVDGTTYVFADFEAGAGYMAGETWSPSAPSRLASLVDVGADLGVYACSAPEKRQQAADEIRRAAIAAARLF